MDVSIEARPMAEARSAISALVGAERDADQAYLAAPENWELGRHLRRIQSARRSAWENLYALQAAEREKFAASRGWRVYNGRQGYIYTDQLIAGRMTYGA